MSNPANPFSPAAAPAAAIIGVIGTWQLGKRNPNISPVMPICAFLVAFIAAGVPIFATISIEPIMVSAPSITAVSSQPAQHP